MKKELIKPRTVLIVCFRYIGDVVVSTPLALSIKSAFPDAAVDYLVFAGTEKAIIKNPHINKIITVPKDKKNISTLWRLFRRYDMAFAAVPSDRSVIAAAVAGRYSFGLAYRGHKELLRRLLLSQYAYIDDRHHIVTTMRDLVQMMCIPFIPQVTIGFDEDDVASGRKLLPEGRYIVMHPYSMKECKYWPISNWASICRLILERTDCIPVFTVTPSRSDVAYLDAIIALSPPEVLTFPCSLTQFAAVLERSAAYIGIDTAATHIAAAAGVPTVAIYGPSLTSYWAPWPNGYEDASPFNAERGLQSVAHVTVVQKGWDCVPCNRESCTITERNRMECLEQLSAEEVFEALLISMVKGKADRQ